MSGASGYIGGHLYKYLLGEGFNVSTIGRSKVARKHYFLENYLKNEILLDEKYDIFIHLAAAGINPKERNIKNLIHINSELPSILLDYA